MADQFVQVPPQSTGLKMDVTELTVGANTVERERINIADPTSATAIATVTAQNALKVDNSAVTQPVSGSLTVTQATGTNLHTVVDSGSITANAGTNLNTSALLLDATFTGRINTQGQKTMAASTPVVIANDQTAFPVTVASTTITSGTVTANQGTSPWVVTDATIGAVNANPPPTSATLVGFVNNSNGAFLQLSGYGSGGVNALATTLVDGGGVQLAVGDNSTPPDANTPVGIPAMGFDPIADKIRVLTVDSNQNLKVVATSTPLPANAALESNGNLSTLVALHQSMLQLLELQREQLAVLKATQLQFAMVTASGIVDSNQLLNTDIPIH